MGKLIEDRNLRNKRYVFKDRMEAGRLLARRLSNSVSSDTLILAIPAGGVAVAEAYEDWYDLTDQEVISLLPEAWNNS